MNHGREIRIKCTPKFAKERREAMMFQAGPQTRGCVYHVCILSTYFSCFVFKLITSLTQFDREARGTISCTNRVLVTAELAARSCLWWYFLA